MRFIGIASGKGGVGKTTIATNLAYTLAKANYRVMLVDGDFGLANVQLALGLQSNFNISHYLAGEKTAKEITSITSDGLMVIPGASGIGSLANLKPDQLKGFLKGLVYPTEPVDFLIFDAAAGISDNVTTLLTECDETLIVVKEDPSSIADGYGIIKVLKTEHDYNAIGIVANGVESEIAGEALFSRINGACNKFLGMDLRYVGYIQEDGSMKDAAKKYMPVTQAFPSSKVATHFRTLAKTISSQSI